MTSNIYLGSPFNRIFQNHKEAQTAFELLRQTATILKITGSYDNRLAVTLSSRVLRFDFCRWTVLRFNICQVNIALLNSLVLLDSHYRAEPFVTGANEPAIYRYNLPFEQILPMSDELQNAYHQTLISITQKFTDWTQTPYQRHHKPEVAEMIFDSTKRDRLLVEGIPDTTLIYERYLTPFQDVIGEKSTEYKTRDTNTDGDNQMSKDIVNQLVEKFSDLKQNPIHHFIIQLRKERAKQLRELFASPTKIDLKIFNHEVWAMERKTLYAQKRQNIYPEKNLTRERAIELEKALLNNELKLQGNYIWGGGSKIYAPQKQDTVLKEQYIRQALQVLNDTGLSPLAKSKKILEIYGFGNNSATGLVMVFHPNNFAIYNKPSREALTELGYSVETLEDFQTAVQKLNAVLKADDYIELDWFLYQFNQGYIQIPSRINQTDPPPKPLYPLSQLLEDCYLDQTIIEIWLRAMERKGQIILYGPPGTGKTFLADKLARHMIGSGDGFYQLIQFHPAYSYEDFMEGLRPQLTEQGQLTYAMQAGRFMTFCQRAAQRHDPCVLIIDEINRANLARIFGELMYLLEYRDQSIQLAGGRAFTIPANVRIIGTMNTADRSIALVDHALRRRFAFISVQPDMTVLQRFHHQRETGFPVDKLITVLERLNQTINDPHYEVGIAYFLHEDLSIQLPDIWQMEIEPYLEEYFFNQLDKIQSFRWNRIKQTIFAVEQNSS
ncbi:AAA family ATPase [Anaerolineales bacterium HSG25]|nr:AAA family ATPase [Anaerolineales bacterium HSG25]